MKNTYVKVTEIEYDTDGVSVSYLRDQGAYLPDELNVEVDLQNAEDGYPEIADVISEVTGFCVLSFQYQAFAK